jgi:Subtilase family
VRPLAIRLLILVTLLLSVAGPAGADLVQLQRGHAAKGAALARSAGGREIARELRIWRVPADQVAVLRKAGVVARSRPEGLLQVKADTVIGDPLVSMQWWRAAVGADIPTPPGPGKPITVVDSGVDMNHPEFANRPNTTVLNEQTTDDEDEDHGTEVSSVIAAPANGVGVVGVYPQAVLRVWDASPFGFLNEGSAIEGIMEAARRGPGVLNLSFGGEDNDPLLGEAIMYAYRNGSVVVAAAGNEGFEGSPVNYPAAYPHVLTVGATNEQGRIAGFSTLSPTVDLAAPGVRIPVAEPFAADASGYILDASGTSFSSPIVAGAAAWVWTVRPNLDNTQLFEVMRRSAKDIGAHGFDHASGYGLLSIPSALAATAPHRDPQEPNEEPNQIEPRATFASGTTPLTQSGRTTGSITARVERAEDPVDLYRIWAPANMTVRARLTGSVVARFMPRSPDLRKARPLAVSKGKVATYSNTGKGKYAYIEIRPDAVRSAEYTLRLTAARR